MPGRAWDAHLSVRALWLSATTATLSMAVIAATEEGGGWAARLALWAVGAPAMGAMGAWVAVRWARARGEARALATLGVRPLRTALGAVLGGTSIGLLGAGVLMAGWAEPSILAPPMVAAFDWVPSEGGMLSPSQGIFVDAEGMVRMVPVTSNPPAPVPRGAFAAWTALLAAVLPVWACLPTNPIWRGMSGLAAAFALVASFHAVLAGSWPVVTLLAAPAWLALDAALRARGGRLSAATR